MQKLHHMARAHYAPFFLAETARFCAEKFMTDGGIVDAMLTFGRNFAGQKVVVAGESKGA